MNQKRKQISGVKSLIRSAEGTLEILLLAIAYYFVWRYGYEAQLFPTYFGLGK
jgi:hypothetical protein